MNVPLTNAILEGAPTDRAGIASALFNASREVAGLLGVTVIGAVLRSSESAALRSGARPAQAFIDGYHSGLWLTIGLLAVGVVLSYVTLRPLGRSAEVTTAELALAELALGEPFNGAARDGEQAATVNADLTGGSAVRAGGSIEPRGEIAGTD